MPKKMEKFRSTSRRLWRRGPRSLRKKCRQDAGCTTCPADHLVSRVKTAPLPHAKATTSQLRKYLARTRGRSSGFAPSRSSVCLILIRADDFSAVRPVGEGWDSGRSKRPREEVNPEFRCDLYVHLLWVDQSSQLSSLPRLVHGQLFMGFRCQGARACTAFKLTGSARAIPYTFTKLAHAKHEEAEDLTHPR